MASQRRSKIKEDISISDYYALHIKALWTGFWGEHVSFWMLCTYFFFEYVRPQDLYPAIDVLPWSQLALLLSIIFSFSDRSIRWVSSIENKLLVLFSLLVVISGVFAFSPSISWAHRNEMLSWFFMFFLVINIVNSEKRLFLFFFSYLLFNLKMSQHGAVDWALRGFSFAEYGLIGAPGYFHNSGEYAIQMLIYSSLIMAFVMSLREYWGKYKKWLLYAAAVTGYMAVVGASSRGAQLGLLTIGVWWVLKLEGGAKSLIIFALVSTVLYFLLPEEQIQRFTEMGDDKSSLLRIAYWEYGLQVIREHPLFGVGYQNWIAYVLFATPQGIGLTAQIQDPHNIYIEVAAESGIPALILFLVMVIFMFIINARTRSITDKQDSRLLYNLTYGLDAGLIGYLVAGSFVTVFYYPFFWVQMAMVVMVNSVAKRRNIEIKKVLRPAGTPENSKKRSNG